MIKKIIILIITILVAHLSNNPVMAVTTKKETGFSVSPPSIEVAINPIDKEQSYVLTISNNSDKSEVFKLSVVDFGSLDKSAGVAFFGYKKSDIENKYALASWVQLEKDAFAIDPGQNLPIKVTILNKESLSPGGHYGAVMIKMEPETVDGQKPVSIAQSYASLIFVKKIGGEIYNLNLKEVTSKSNPFVMTDTFRLRFQNSGNVHLVPRGKIEITDPLDRLVLKGIINLDSAIIMPESFREYVVNLNKLEKLYWPGKYNLKISYRYQGQEKDESYNTSFPYFGGWLIWVLLAGLIVLVTKIVVYRTLAKK